MENFSYGESLCLVAQRRPVQTQNCCLGSFIIGLCYPFPPRLTMELPSHFQPAHPSHPGAKIKWRFDELSQPATVAWRLAPFCPWLTGHVSAPRMASFDPIIISLVVGHVSLVAVESDSPLSLSSSGPSLPRLPTYYGMYAFTLANPSSCCLQVIPGKKEMKGGKRSEHTEYRCRQLSWGINQTYEASSDRAVRVPPIESHLHIVRGTVFIHDMHWTSYCSMYIVPFPATFRASPREMRSPARESVYFISSRY